MMAIPDIPAAHVYRHVRIDEEGVTSCVRVGLATINTLPERWLILDYHQARRLIDLIESCLPPEPPRRWWQRSRR